MDGCSRFYIANKQTDRQTDTGREGRIGDRGIGWWRSQAGKPRVATFL